MVRILAVVIPLLCAWVTSLPPVPSAMAHPADTPDNILKSIGVDENPGGQVPPDLLFRDQDGRVVRLADLFGSGPVILTLNYYTCPMLCPLTLRNLLASANGIAGITLARDFRIVTVSIDPDETREAARGRADEMHAMMEGIPDPGMRWPFLIGGREEIAKLAGSVGFRYRKVGAEFAHPDLGIVLTPSGKISRYLYGVQQDPATLKLALIEAADGKIGDSATMNRVLLFCFHYDPIERKYGLYAKNIMKAGGVLTLALLGVLYLALWKRRTPRGATR